MNAGLTLMKYILTPLSKKCFFIICHIICHTSNHTKCVFLSNQKYNIQPTLINLYPNKYVQESHYYPFEVKLDKRVGSCNALNDLFNTTCVPNKTEDFNLSVFSMITKINESKTLTKHIPCEYECRFDERKCASDQWWSNDKCQRECKKRHLCKKDYVWNPATCNREKGKYLASIIVDSAIMHNKVIEPCEETCFNE